MYQQSGILCFSAIIGKVDAIFDRGALEAINVSDRQKYASLMADLCTSGATLLACVQEYNLELYEGEFKSNMGEGLGTGE